MRLIFYGTVKRPAVRAMRLALALAFALALLDPAAQAQILFMDQQSASPVKLKQVEVGGAFHSVVHSIMDESFLAWNIYGLNLGYGLAKNVEIRVRFGYVASPGVNSNANVLNFGVKIGLWKNILAADLPFEVAFGQDYGPGSWLEVQPGLIASLPVAKRLEIIPSVRACIAIGGGSDTMMAVNLGLGYFAEADRSLIIRPEIGILFDPSGPGSYLQFGLGFSYRTKPKT